MVALERGAYTHGDRAKEQTEFNLGERQPAGPFCERSELPLGVQLRWRETLPQGIHLPRGIVIFPPRALIGAFGTSVNRLICRPSELPVSSCFPVQNANLAIPEALCFYQMSVCSTEGKHRQAV